MRKIKIGLLGLGTIGSSLLKILKKEQHVLTKRTGLSLEIVHICDRSWQKKKALIGSIPASAEAGKILEDRSIDIVVELIGGIDPARSWLQRALENGKSIVTANKAVLAACGNELLALAQKNGLEAGFEAAVGGAMPVLRNFRRTLVGDNIHSLYGILNGTTNFILSQMARGMDYSQALSLAQKQGYAESDPGFDVGGTDAAQKLSILAALSFDIPILGDRVKTQGIEGIKAADLKFAASLGYRIRPLATARKSHEKTTHKKTTLELSVHPAMVPEKHLLASVDDAMNAVLIESEYAQKTVFIGPGAGGLPTASSVISDLVFIGQKNKQQAEIWLTNSDSVPQEGDFFCRFYLRLTVQDRPGSLAEIARVLATHGISIAAIQQYEEKKSADIVVLTSSVSVKKMSFVLKEIHALPNVDSVLSLRIEESLFA